MTLKKQSGISMIEILVTVIVIAVGLLGVAVSQSVAVKETGSSAQRTAAVNAVNDFVERMRMSRSSIKDYWVADASGNQVTQTACSTNASMSNPAICGATYKDKNRQAATAATSPSCSAANKAKFDLWDSFCPKGNLDGRKGKSGNQDYMAGLKLYVKCLNPATGAARTAKGDCLTTDMVEIKLSWTESKNKRKESASLDQEIIIRTAL